MKGYRIKTVSRVTGLSPEVLRAWERRYQVIEPQRTPGGYREYSEDDVERLRLLRALTSRGYSIGEIASLPAVELQGLFRAQDHEQGTTPAVTERGRHAMIVDHLAALAGDLDSFGFRRALRRVLVLLPSREAMRDVLEPLLQQLRRRSERSARDSAAVRLAVAEVRGFTGVLSAECSDDGPVALIAAATNEPQSLLLLQAFLCCAHQGWRTVLAGTGVGAADLQEMARSTSAGLVCLVVDEPIETEQFLALLDTWEGRPRGDAVVVFVGSVILRYAHAMRQRGVHMAAGADELAEIVSALLLAEDGSGR
jgi:DNA-binding transcriptional MerR regulator